MNLTSSSFAVHCVLLMASLLRSWSCILHSPILMALEHTKSNRVSNSSDLNLEDNGSNPENILYNQSKLIRPFLYGLVPLRAFSSWGLITICRKSENPQYEISAEFQREPKLQVWIFHSEADNSPRVSGERVHRIRWWQGNLSSQKVKLPQSWDLLASRTVHLQNEWTSSMDAHGSETTKFFKDCWNTVRFRFDYEIV